MTTEALLAYAHFLAILTMTVFLASEAALCRKEWLNAAVVERLARVDLIYGISAIVVLLTKSAVRQRFARVAFVLDKVTGAVLGALGARIVQSVLVSGKTAA